MIDVLEISASRARGDPSHQLKTKSPQTIQQSIDTTTPNMPDVSHISSLGFPFSKHQASTAVQILQFIHPCCENQNFGRAMASTRTRHRDPAEAQWLNLAFTSGRLKAKPRTRARSTWNIAKVGAADWLVHNFETEQRLNFCELPGLPKNSSDAPSGRDGSKVRVTILGARI